MKLIIKSIILVIATAAMLTSCVEDNIVPEPNILELTETEKRFLNYSDDHLKSGELTLEEKFIATVTADLETQNEKDRFIEEFVEQHGYPDWNMVRWFTSDHGEEVAQIPVLKDDDCETRAVIICAEKSNQLTYCLLERSNIDNYVQRSGLAPTQDKLRDLFIIFDFEKFGESSFLPNGRIVSLGDSADKTKSASGWVTITICYNIDVYDGPSGKLLSSRVECEVDFQYVLVADNPEFGGGGSSGSSGAGGGSGSGAGGAPIVIIDPTFKKTKAECVYEKLQSSKLMENLLKEFVGSSKCHVTYTVVDDLPSAYSYDQALGKCINNKDGTMTIIINSRYFDKLTAVEIAKTLLHETIHAYIFQEIAAMGGYDNLENSTFVQLYDYYKLYGPEEFQHEYMSQFYIVKMADTLRAYDNNRYSLDHYKALAWQGLTSSVEYYNMTQSQKDEIDRKVSIINSQNKDCK